MSASVYKKRVKEFVTSDSVTLDAGDSIHEALVLMSENRVSALPVVDHDNHLMGIISTMDILAEFVDAAPV